MLNQKKSYDLIDLLKFIASILIVIMHANLFYHVNQSVQFYAVQMVARWGVPFFFAISSYFLFSKSENGNITFDQLMKYVKRIMILYGVWLIVGIVPHVHNEIYLKGVSNLSTWLVFIRNTILASTFMGSWYLTSSVFSAFLIYFLSKKMSNKWILLICFVVYALCTLTSTYRNLLPQSVNNFIATYYGSTCNNLLGGCLFFAIGKLIAEKREKISSVPKLYYLIGSIVFYGLYYLEISLLKKYGILGTTDMSLLLIPFTFCFISLVINVNIKIKGAIVLRKASTIIYCSHGAIMFVSKNLSQLIFGNRLSYIYTAIMMIILAVVVFTILYFDLKKKSKFAKLFS